MVLGVNDFMYKIYKIGLQFASYQIREGKGGGRGSLGSYISAAISDRDITFSSHSGQTAP